MKVTRDMLHEDLQPYYGRFKLMPKLMGSRLSVRFFSFLLNRSTIGKNIKGLNCQQISIPSTDGKTQTRVRVYRPEKHEGKLPLMLYLHGGGYLTGTPELATTSIEHFIKTRPCVVVAPDYRKALTKPFPAGFNDCYETLIWAKANADSLGIHNSRFIVAGHSAGGGLTAAVTLKARDTGDVDIAFQMPIYPMIDDQQPNDPHRQMSSPGWDTTMNRFGWQAYLADLLKDGKDIPAYAAASRSKDCAGLPPTITFVGDREPFFWETESYVQALREEGVEVAYKLFEGCFHGFDIVVPDASISQLALAFTYEHFADFYDRFVISELGNLSTPLNV